MSQKNVVKYNCDAMIVEQVVLHRPASGKVTVGIVTGRLTGREMGRLTRRSVGRLTGSSG